MILSIPVEYKKLIRRKMRKLMMLLLVFSIGVIYSRDTINHSSSLRDTSLRSLQIVRNKTDSLDVKKNIAQFVADTQSENIKNANDLYSEFISGKSSVGGVDMDYISIPTGEPNRRYYTLYAIFDSNGDEIPELHVKTGRDYYIFTYRDGKLKIWESYFSNPHHHHPLKDGAFIEDSYGDKKRAYYFYYRLDLNANIIESFSFYKFDSNENNIYDENDVYVFDEITCTKEDWESKSKQYLYTGEDGFEHIRNEIEWTVFCNSI